MALSILLHENGHTVTSWTCFEEECKLLREQRGNEKLLPGIKLPEEIEITTDLNGAAAADLVLMAVPSFAVHSTAQQLSGIIQAGIPIVNVGKGTGPGQWLLPLLGDHHTGNQRKESGGCP